MNFNQVNDVIQSVGQRDGLSKLRLDSNGCAGLALTDGVVLYFELNPQHEALYLYSPLPEVAEEKERPSSMYQDMLRFSCLNGDLSVSMHPTRESFYIQFRLPLATLSVAALDNAIDRLTAGRRMLLQQLQSGSASSSQPPISQAVRPARQQESKR